MNAFIVSVVMAVTGQWSQLSVERVEQIPTLRVLANTTQTVSRCGPGWVLAGYATTGSPATIMYGNNSGMLGALNVPYCYGIHGRGNRLAYTSSNDKVLHIMEWNGATWVEGCQTPLASHFPTSWPYHVYIAENGAIIIGSGYPSPLSLVTVVWVNGNAPVVNGPFSGGTVGSWKGFSGNGILLAHGPNESLISHWTWDPVYGAEVVACPVTPGNDLVMNFRNGPDTGDQVIVRSRSLARGGSEWNWMRTSGSIGNPLSLAVYGYGLDDLVAWQPLGGGYWLTARKLDSYYGALEVTIWNLNGPENVIVQRKRLGRADGMTWDHNIIPIGYFDGLAGFCDWQHGEIYWIRVATSYATRAIAPASLPNMATSKGAQEI